MDQYTRKIIGFGVHACDIDGPTLCRMFNDATSGQGWPEHISSDNDPLFQYHRWKANMRVLEIIEIKSLSHVPMSQKCGKANRQYQAGTTGSDLILDSDRSGEQASGLAGLLQ